jgi:hypothetical protein
MSSLQLLQGLLLWGEHLLQLLLCRRLCAAQAAGSLSKVSMAISRVLVHGRGVHVIMMSLWQRQHAGRSHSVFQLRCCWVQVVSAALEAFRNASLAPVLSDKLHVRHGR